MNESKVAANSASHQMQMNEKNRKKRQQQDKNFDGVTSKRFLSLLPMNGSFLMG